MADVHKILAISKVVTPPSPATSGLSLTCTAGEGARFDTGTQWMEVWPDGVDPSWAAGLATGGNFEIIRVTSRSSDIFTLASRAQKGTTARTVIAGDQIAQIIMPEDAIEVITYQATPADPAAVTGATDKMQGIAGSITPNSPKIFVAISGTFEINSAGKTGTVQGRYGTGSAPANGAAVAGTAFSGKISSTPATSGLGVPFCVQGVITGLTVGTAYWLDLATSASANALTVRAISVSAYDIGNQAQ